MVGVAEEAELSRLESQVENGGGNVWEYLCLVKKLKVRCSEKVLRHGMALLNDAKGRSKLGGEVWTLYEQVAIAAMDCRHLDIAKEYIQILLKKFPDSLRVGRLEGMWFEAKGSWTQADKVYSGLLEEHPLDQQIHKRKVAIAKAQGNLSGAVDLLNKYLEIFMADNDAWRELADLYISLQMYKQAAFCFEELILAQPSNALFHLSYAEAVLDTCRNSGHVLVLLYHPTTVLGFLCVILAALTANLGAKQSSTGKSNSIRSLRAIHENEEMEFCRPAAATAVVKPPKSATCSNKGVLVSLWQQLGITGCTGVEVEFFRIPFLGCVVRQYAHQQRKSFESCLFTTSERGVALGASNEPGALYDWWS